MRMRIASPELVCATCARPRVGPDRALRYYAVMEEETPFLAKQAMCVFAPACMAIGANVVKDFETGAIGPSSPKPFRVSVCAARTLKRQVLSMGHAIAAARAFRSASC